MKSTQFFSKIFLVLCIILASCQRDDGITNDSNQNENIPDTFSDYFGNEISRNFLGTVIDKNHNPIEGVSITIGNTTALTDNNGVFIIKDANVFERFGYIKAEKAGYIHGSRSVVPTNGTNKVTIMLLEETITGTVSSGSVSTVTAPDGSAVSFDGNFIKEDGTAYSGSVNVIMHHLDPTDDDVELQMPGMLYAQNEDGAERMLQTLGMLAVELRGSGGEDLNLAEGSTSEIKIPVDASLLSTAPAAIPLWYFDETLGVWKEEGEATLQGNMYVGTVSHFSFWNCDIPAEAITLCVNVTNEDGQPVSNIKVVITSATFGSRNGYTNENGEVCGYVPSNETLTLSIINYEICGASILHSENIGPFNSDSSISVIVTTLDDSAIIFETVRGRFKTCDNEDVNNGYVRLKYDNFTFIDIVENGTFEINLFRCSAYNTFSVRAFDADNLQSTDNINYTFTSPLTDLGILQPCNNLTEFIQYTIDDEETVLIAEDIYAARYVNNSGQNLVINNGWSSDENCFILKGRLNDPEYAGTYNHVPQSSQEKGFYYYSLCDNIPNTENNSVYNLTSIGTLGEYIDLNFSGTFLGTDGNTHTISGIIHVLRDQ